MRVPSFCFLMPHSQILQLVQRSTLPALNDMANDYKILDVEDPIEKDRTEIELEKLVLGDESGFHEGLKSYKHGSTDFQGLLDGERQQPQGSSEDGKLEQLDDADVGKSNCASVWLSLNNLPAVLLRLHSVRCQRPRLTTSIDP